MTDQQRQYFYPENQKFPNYFRLLGAGKTKKVFRARVAHIPRADDILIMKDGTRWLITLSEKVERKVYEGQAILLTKEKK